MNIGRLPFTRYAVSGGDSRSPSGFTLWSKSFTVSSTYSVCIITSGRCKRYNTRKSEGMDWVVVLLAIAQPSRFGRASQGLPLS